MAGKKIPENPSTSGQGLYPGLYAGEIASRGTKYPQVLLGFGIFGTPSLVFPRFPSEKTGGVPADSHNFG